MKTGWLPMGAHLRDSRPGPGVARDRGGAPPTEPGRARPGMLCVALRARSRTAWLPALLAAFLGSGCAGTAPTLPEPYGGLAERPRPPLVIVPGMMGSRLVEPGSGDTLWPAGLWEILTGGFLEGLWALAEVPVGEPPAVVPRGLVMRSFGQDHYEGLVRRLEAHGGYTCRDAEELEAGTDCVLFAWDWRRDLVQAAGRLDALVERIRDARGDPDLRVDLLAHSAGGLIARYYARFGARDVLDRPPEAVAPDFAGAAKLRRVLLAGVPNQGSISGLQLAMKGHQAGLGAIPPELIATMPSVYQVLPHPDRAWMMDIRGRRLDRDLYDPGVWEQYRVSVHAPDARRRIRARFDDPQRAGAYLERLEARLVRGLERGRRFHRALSSPAPQPLPLRYDVLGADCVPTPAKCLLEHVEGSPVIRLHPQNVRNRVAGVDYEGLMLAPGDTRVTKRSLLARSRLDAPGAPFAVRNLALTCADHGALPSSFDVGHNALNALLY